MTVQCFIAQTLSISPLYHLDMSYILLKEMLNAKISSSCFSAPICVMGAQHITQRVVVVIGGIVGGIGLSLSCLLFNIEYVIVTFGALYGKILLHIQRS